MTGDIFAQLSVVLVIAAAIAYAMRLLKQPLIVGYILSGILVGPSVFHLISDNRAFEAFSQIGIALLLFIIGLELSVTVIKRLGKPVFLTAAAMLITVGTIGYLVSVAFHFHPVEALLLGISLFFSSTIIIAKVLSDKKEITRLNGQIAVGVILFDDVVATFALLFVAAGSKGALDFVDIAALIIKAVIVILVLFLLSSKVLPRAVKAIAKNQELLFISALAWGFGVATIISYIGFSIEIGALFAGVALAHLPYSTQIVAKLKPLRDFFIILFFLSLGEHFELHNLTGVIVPSIILSILVLILKPLVAMISLGSLKYTRRTSFKTGINLSQISEFSIILILLATNEGLVRPEVAAVTTLVALITITISTYLMQYDNQIYRKIEQHLVLFERATANETKTSVRSFPLVLVGYKNGGSQYLRTFKTLDKKFVVVDYDPEVIEDLERLNIEYFYGDASDPEILSELNVEHIKLLINTVGDHTLNKTLVSYVRKRNKKAVIVCYSANYADAAELYKLGVNYVMLPHFVGSERLNHFITTHGIDPEGFDNYREKHMLQIGKAALGKQPVQPYR